MSTEQKKHNSLIVPVNVGGPLSYQNWLAFINGADWNKILEFPLFTDAQITGDKPGGLGPYAVLNTVADRNFTETVVGAVLRISMHLDLAPRMIEDWDHSQESSYHGGDMNDEIAALLSLSMGIRFRLGRLIRYFDPRSDDQRGQPYLYDLHLMPLGRRRGARLVIPSADGPACLNEKLGLLSHYVEMTPENANVVIKAARSYQEAMWLAEVQPELTWLFLVQAVETAADHWAHDSATPLARVKDWGPGSKLLDYLNNLTLSNEQIDTVAGILSPYVGSTRKFLGFLTNFLPQPRSSRPPTLAQVDWSDLGMKNVLKRIYECRSNAVHNGQPFPSIMCMAPIKYDGSYEERPTCSGAQVYGATWSGKDIPILLHTFEYIVREALLTWWKSLIPLQG